MWLRGFVRVGDLKAARFWTFYLNAQLFRYLINPLGGSSPSSSPIKATAQPHSGLESFSGSGASYRVAHLIDLQVVYETAVYQYDYLALRKPQSYRLGPLSNDSCEFYDDIYKLA